MMNGRFTIGILLSSFLSLSVPTKVMAYGMQDALTMKEDADAMTNWIEAWNNQALVEIWHNTSELPDAYNHMSDFINYYNGDTWPAWWPYSIFSEANFSYIYNEMNAINDLMEDVDWIEDELNTSTGYNYYIGEAEAYYCSAGIAFDNQNYSQSYIDFSASYDNYSYAYNQMQNISAKLAQIYSKIVSMQGFLTSYYGYFSGWTRP